MHISSRLKEVNMEDIPNVTSDIIERLKCQTESLN
jgi:hypothetical protein